MTRPAAFTFVPAALAPAAVLLLAAPAVAGMVAPDAGGPGPVGGSGALTLAPPAAVGAGADGPSGVTVDPEPNPQAAPEPGSMALLALVGAGGAAAGWRNRRAARGPAA